MNKELIASLTETYAKTFGLTGKEKMLFSPGRINILGEHVDYNGGVVLPAAIDLGIYMIAAPREDHQVHLHSKAFQETHMTSSSNPVAKGSCVWANYILGVIRQFQDREIDVPGFNLVFDGDLPIGAGLSSSAALECGIALMLNHFTRSEFTRLDLALMSQKAEHEFAGVQCGIMDQAASILGKAGQVIEFDTLNLNFKYNPLELGEYELVLIDSNVKHSLGTSEYNTRRAECAAVLKVLEAEFGIQSLRSCTMSMLQGCQDKIDPKSYLRAAYVIEEMERVRSAVRAMASDDILELGRLMFATHDGLSHQYEVSCEEMDFLVTEAKRSDAVIGSRMMGGGFGGCTLNLIRSPEVDDVVSALSAAYRNTYQIDTNVIPVRLSEGTNLFNL